ncbi:MAG: DsbE family thiol:disulfide interchange protein [Pseudomonadota bacterium]
MWRYLGPLIGVLALGAIFAVTLARIGTGELDVREIPSPLIGKPAPQFELPSVQDENERISTAALAGRPWVLNGWGPGCPGCRQEHDTLLRISSDSVVPIIGLNWKDERSLAMQWLTQLGNPYTKVAFDPEGDVAIDWGVYGSPETFLVSAEGIVIAKHIGPMTEQIWREKFLPLLAEKSGGGA